MIQAWGIAFKDKSEYKIATNLYNIMKTEGWYLQYFSMHYLSSNSFSKEACDTHVIL